MSDWVKVRRWPLDFLAGVRTVEMGPNSRCRMTDRKGRQVTGSDNLGFGQLRSRTRGELYAGRRLRRREARRKKLLEQQGGGAE